MGAMKETTVGLYAADYYAWVHHQAEALRRGDMAGLDIQHLIDEVESLGRSEERELESRMEQLLMHLLKWQYQPATQGPSWTGSIREQRRRLDRLFRRMPSLRAKVGEFLADDYEVARELAAAETGLALDRLPEACPYTVVQILDLEWLPTVTA